MADEPNLVSVKSTPPSGPGPGGSPQSTTGSEGVEERRLERNILSSRSFKNIRDIDHKTPNSVQEQ